MLWSAKLSGSYLTERDREQSRDKVTSVRNDPYEEMKTGHCVWEERDSGEGQAQEEEEEKENKEDHPWEEKYLLVNRQNFKAKVYSGKGKEGGKADLLVPGGGAWRMRGGETEANRKGTKQGGRPSPEGAEGLERKGPWSNWV